MLVVWLLIIDCSLLARRFFRMKMKNEWSRESGQTHLEVVGRILG